MAKSTNVNKNTLFNTIKSIFGVIYPLITFPYISRVLMAENVGKINFGNSVVSYFSLIASLGVTTYAVRECSKYRENRDKLGEVSSQIISINVVSTIIAYAALIVMLLFARSLDNYRILICIQSSTILFTTLGADWLNTAMEDFRFIAVRTVGMQVISLILMFLFVRRPSDYLIYAIVSVLASSGANIINIFYRRKYCCTRFTFHMNLKQHLPSILLLFSLILSQTIYVNSDTTILGLIKGDFQVGLYSTSIKIYNIINTVIASIAWVVMPQLSYAFAKENYVEINRLLKYAMNFIVVIGLPCLVGLNVITKEIIYLIAGQEYVDATLSLKILTISLACSLLGGWVSNMILLPSGREKICLRTTMIAAGINLILNLIFIPRWGLNAAASTTAAAEFVGVCLNKKYVEKEICIDNKKEMLRAPVAGSILIVICSIIIRRYTNSPYLIAIETIGVSAIVYVCILFIMKNEFFLEFIAPIMKKIRGEK